VTGAGTLVADGLVGADGGVMAEAPAVETLLGFRDEPFHFENLVGHFDFCW